MRALVKLDESVGYELKQDYPIDEPVADEAQIKVSAVSICGSDINLWKWNETAKVIAALPFIPGHEAVGVVVKTGPESKVAVGQRVAVENHFYCEDCVLCDEGRGDICMNMSQYGHGKGTTQGGCSQLSNISSKYLYPINSNITDEQACLIEPMGVAHNIIERIDVVGKDVLVIGAGPVGLFCVANAKALGARRVIAADLFDDKLTLAIKMGASDTINVRKVDLGAKVMELTGGNGIERICEASGHAPTLNSSFKWLRKGGKMGIVGLPKDAVKLDNPLPDLVFKSLEIHTVHGRRIFHTWEQCEKLIESGQVVPELTVSHRIPMSQYQQAFDALLKGEACKIIMDPQS